MTISKIYIYISFCYFFLAFGNKQVEQFSQVVQDEIKRECIMEETSKKESSKKEQYLSVKRVVDGDTFVVINESGADEKIRLIGVNAPVSRNTGRKKKEPFGMESKKFLTNYLTGKKVKLEYDVQKTDKYGRTLAYVYMENGVFLNEYLVKEGYAQIATYPPNVKYVEVFRKAQKLAREKSKGLWK